MLNGAGTYQVKHAVPENTEMIHLRVQEQAVKNYARYDRKKGHAYSSTRYMSEVIAQNSTEQGTGGADDSPYELVGYYLLLRKLLPFQKQKHELHNAKLISVKLMMQVKKSTSHITADSHPRTDIMSQGMAPNNPCATRYTKMGSPEIRLNMAK